MYTGTAAEYLSLRDFVRIKIHSASYFGSCCIPARMFKSESESVAISEPKGSWALNCAPEPPAETSKSPKCRLECVSLEIKS